MKRLLFLLLCGLVFSPGGFPARGAEAKPNKVGVMKFEVGEDSKASLGKFLSERFTYQLVGSKQYTVVDWEEIDRVLGMENKSQTAVSADEARRMAISKCGLDKLFLGRVDKLGTKYHLTVKLLGLDLRVERMELGVADSEEKLPETVDQIGAAFLVDNSDEAKALRAAQQAQAAAATAKAEKARQETEALRAAQQAQTASATAKAEKAKQETEAQAKTEAQRKAGATAATRQSPWINSLGMVFVPVAGTPVLFSVWDVRVKDYRAYAGAAGGVDNEWQSPGFTQGDAHPVVNVSWNDAQAFCRWLTGKERGEGKLNEGQSYRLPREVEWNQAVGSAKYPWGESWPPPSGAGNYSSSLGVDNYEYTSPVGSFAANPFGLYDMGGDVWQWCEDWYDSSQQYRVLRGASWGLSGPEYLLSSYRCDRTPGLRDDDVGFRVVLVFGGSAR